MITNDDRRESKRISYICEVECEGSGLNYLATRIQDLSTTGAFIDSLTCHPPGSHLRLRFRIHDTLIETAAEVRYAMPQMGMGVRFLDLTPGYAALLESLIEGKPLIPTAVTAGPPDAVADQLRWKTPDMLLGNFAIVSMFDVIQLIENNKLTGVLTVVSPAAKGEIQFNDGHIVGAQNGETGIEALKTFLDVTEGSFEFKRSDTPYPRTIESSGNMSLMLDLLQVVDGELRDAGP
ncbi:MAG TPA: DUF4388 domain-containing protein [Blastocatellia bacterium]|nr:DUF4388 domain-containing protein [Blastocatellia bacterium]